MVAGPRNTLITLQRYTATLDGYGEETRTWASIGTAWAAVFYGRGSERREQAMEQGEQPATFQVLSNSVTRSLGLADRITLAGNAWDIRGIAPETPERGLVEITAIRAA